MTSEFTCTNCQKDFKDDWEFDELEVKCPHCHQYYEVEHDGDYAWRISRMRSPVKDHN